MHFDTLAFIALIIVAGFLRWLSQQAEKAKRKPKERGAKAVTTQRTQTHDETDEERIRRFLEALGQPTSSKPPPKITPRPIQKRTVAPRRRSVLSPLPPVTTVPPDFPPATPVTAEPASADTPRVFETPRVGATPTEKVCAVPSKPLLFPETAKAAAIYPEVSALLKSERGLRDAIILREIFGPPRGLQPEVRLPA